MSGISTRPLTDEQYDSIESLESLSISGPNEGIYKISATTFGNKTFGGSYVLPTASASIKGGIKIGARLTMTGEVLSADVQSVTVEGTAVLSTGEMGGTKFLREDGDGTSSWQAIPAAGGDVLGPATNTANYIPQWNGANSKTLKDGIDPATLLTTSTGLKLDQTTPQSVINGAPIFDAIDFDITPSLAVATEGRLQWNATDGTLNLGMSGGDITMQIGQEMFAKVRNEAGYETIANGQVVYISGRTGVFPDIQKARSDAEATSDVLGVATQEILSPAYGFITTTGYVRGIKTDYSGAGNWGTTWNLNDPLYVSKTVAGQLTNVEPDAPHHSDVVATVAVVGGVGTGSILVRINKHKTLEELSDVDGGAFDTNGQTIVYDTDNNYFTRSNAYPTSHHYTGFPRPATTTLSFDDGTYTLSLTASDDKVWIDGIEYNIDTLQKALSVAQEAVSGLYWFWITAPLGVPQLNVDIAAPGFDKCLVATVYWNTTTNKGIVSDERHWMGRDQWMHEYLHETVGARYAAGMTTVFTDTTISVEGGEFYDEDIEHYWTDPITTVRVMYHNGSADWEWDILTTPYKVVNPVAGADLNLRYNNGNALATVDNNKYMNQWVYATGDVNYPVQVFIGTAQYVTLALARAAQPPSFGALATAENKLIYRVTYQNNGGTPDYQEALDYRTASSLPGTYVATDHGTLTGLTDLDHPASAIINTPAGDIVATTVQAAINELDTEKLALAGGTMTGNLLFTDNTLDIGASGATRPRTGYFGTSINLGIGSNTTGSIVYKNATNNNTVTINSGVTSTSYALTLPVAVAAVTGYVLTSTDAGVLSWAAPTGTGANTALSNLASVAINETLVSDTDNTDALGTTAIAWSDLFLGSGSVITFNSAPSTADVTITHSANTLTIGGGNLAMGGNNITGVGTINGTIITASTQLIADSTSDTPATGPLIDLRRSRDGDPTDDVADDDVLGEVRFRGYKTDAYYEGAIIRAVVNGTPGASDMPTELILATSADGSATPTTRLTIGANGTSTFAGTVALGANNLTMTGSVADTTNRATAGFFVDLTVTNAIAGSVTGNAGTVTNATLTTALTVNTGTVTLTGNVANSSALTIGAGAVSVSGSNTGDQTTMGAISDTKANFNTACSDGNFLYVGDAPTGHAASHAVSAADTVFPADPNADKYLMWDDDPGTLAWVDAPAPEGTAVKSTGEGGGTKFLREDGDGTCSWQTVSATLLSDADYNTKGGTDAGKNLVAGAQYNTYYGYEAGISSALTDNGADNNTGVGYQTLYSNKGGYQNIAIGNGVLYTCTYGIGNTGIGYLALNKSTGGGIDFNTAIGHSALNKSINGYNNTAIGSNSLLNITSGYSNIAIGSDAGSQTSVPSANQTSNSSIYIGRDTQSSANGNTNEIVIGNAAIGVGSNTAVIGNSSVTAVYLGSSTGAAKLVTSSIELGAASDTSITRVGAGQLAIEGANIVTVSSVDSITGAKTFDKDKLLVKGTSTGTTNLTTANTSSTSYTATFPAKDGTVAMTSDIIGGLTWSAVTSNGTMVVDTGTLANKGTLLELTLPVTSAVGKVLRIAGMNAGLWKVIQAANQYIKFGDVTSTTGATGYISSTLTYDAVEMVCIEADKGWVVVSSIGEITIA